MPINQHKVAVPTSCHVRVCRARSPLSTPAVASSKENVTLALSFIGLYKSHFSEAIKTICVNTIFYSRKIFQDAAILLLTCLSPHLWVLRTSLVFGYYEWSGDVPSQI